MTFNEYAELQKVLPSASERLKFMINKLQRHKSSHPRQSFDEINTILHYLYWCYRPSSDVEPDWDLTP